MIQVKKIILLLICLILFNSCVNTVRFPIQNVSDDFEKSELCVYSSITKPNLDTTVYHYNSTGIYSSIKKVNGINTNQNEYGLSFAVNETTNNGFITVRRLDFDSIYQDKIFSIEFLKIDSANFKNTLIVKTNYKLQTIGTPAVNSINGESFFTSKNVDVELSNSDYNIYKGKIKDNVIEKCLNSEQSSLGFWDGQPSISIDGNTMYFVSDRPGGFGGTDIYISQRDYLGIWSRPQNLGPFVNTPCDELTPLICDNDKLLIFSSSGGESAGGYDLFKCPLSYNRRPIKKSENLGRPINTVYDELSPSLPSWGNSDTLLYYASNQNPDKGFDIFVFHQKRDFLPKFVVNDSISKFEKENYTDKIDEGDDDNEIIKLIEEGSKKNQKRFNFKKKRKQEISKGSGDSTSFTYDIEFIPPNYVKINKKYTYVPEIITLRVNFPYNEFNSPYPFTLDSNGYATKEYWGDMLDKIAQVLLPAIKNGKYQFDIVGHTDSIGSDSYNFELGLKRANFVKEELIKRGVSADGLITKSEGKNKFVLPKENETDDQYRLRLRRVEIVKRGKVKSN